MTNEEAIKWFENRYDNSPMPGAKMAFRMAIEALKAQDKSLDEWCTDCKEYDHEKHNCPRFNRVIRTALQDGKDINVHTKIPVNLEITKIKKHQSDFSDLHSACTEGMPSAEPERTGRWVDDGSELGCACSECGASLDEYISNLNEYNHLIKYPRFCQNCGSDNSGGGA